MCRFPDKKELLPLGCPVEYIAEDDHPSFGEFSGGVITTIVKRDYGCYSHYTDIFEPWGERGGSWGINKDTVQRYYK